MMLTEIESPVERSESTTPADPHAAIDTTLAAIGMEFDPHHFHETNVSGEARTEGSGTEGSGCPFAQFFSGFFGGETA
jgi:hypothetical protein